MLIFLNRDKLREESIPVIFSFSAKNKLCLICGFCVTDCWVIIFITLLQIFEVRNYIKGCKFFTQIINERMFCDLVHI